MFHTRSDSEPRGQVLVIVAVAFTAMMALLAVLFDWANGKVTRRDMQDGGDAAALAGANVVHVGTPRGCAATAGSTTPRASIVAAVNSSLAINLPWYDATTASVTCPAGHENQAVAVELSATAPQFLGGFVGGPIQVSTRSAAVNRYINWTAYSIVQLDPGNQSWPNGRRGCPSVLLSGGPTVRLQATMQVNSGCTAANGGALGTNGNGGSLTMENGAPIRLHGGYNPGAMTITPAPTTGVAPIADPLRNLPPIDTDGMTLHDGRVTLGNGIHVLQPGIYRGGIELDSQAVALLRPGIYVMEGGGFDVGAQAKVLSVSNSVSTPNYANWAADCPANACGVLIYNTSHASYPMDEISVAAGSTLKLRAYDPDAMNGDGVADYENILIWQAANPFPTASYFQPIVRLNGGGNVDIRGTVYAPSAKVEMGGNSGGSGGDVVNLTLQFISWDLEFRGNSTIIFKYIDADIARPTNYCLVD
jgi:hypothetical protein